MSKRPIKLSTDVDGPGHIGTGGSGGDVPQLETRHFQWILDAAIERFAEKIRTSEVNLVRHRAFLNEPACERFAGSKSREELIAHETTHLQQYRAIYAFCVKARNRVVEASAKEFAESIREWLHKR